MVKGESSVMAADGSQSQLAEGPVGRDLTPNTRPSPDLELCAEQSQLGEV